MGIIKRHRHHHHHHLPEEIIEEIIVRLPVKSIIRFQIVSKSWLNLISTTSFIYKHLITSDETFLSRVFFICTLPRQHETGQLPSHECQIRTMNICADIQIPAVGDINFKLPCTPLPRASECLEFVDHCNGIVCLKFVDSILLVNPSLKQVKSLPIPPVPISDGRGFCKFVAFGFDHTTMDYKVLRMLNLKYVWNANLRQRFEIFSLKSNAWRKLDEFPSVFAAGDGDAININECRRPVFLNGVIHWCVGSILSEWRMLMFNTTTESFDHVEFPQDWDKRVYRSYRQAKIVPDLFVLNQDTLAFASYLCPGFPSTNADKEKKEETWTRLTYVDIWSMNKENKEETWTKLYSIGPLTPFKKPLTFSKKQRFLYEAVTGELVLYDLLNQNTCVSRLPCAAHGLDLDIIELGECKSSVVSLINL